MNKETRTKNKEKKKMTERPAMTLSSCRSVIPEIQNIFRFVLNYPGSRGWFKNSGSRMRLRDDLPFKFIGQSLSTSLKAAGFTLLETLIAITILVLAIVGPL